MKLEPFKYNGNEKRHAPAISFAEIVELSGFTPAVLRGKLRAKDAPKHQFVRRSNSMQNKWYVAAEVKTWLKSMKENQ